MDEAPPPPTLSRYSRKNPFLAELTCHEPLTKPGSEKDTRHFVVDLGDSGITYTPGDSLAVFARNPPALVDQVLALLHFDSAITVKNSKGELVPLRQTLLEDYTLNRANRKI